MLDRIRKFFTAKADDEPQPSPTTPLEGAVPESPVPWPTVVVAAPAIRYQGQVRTMTDKELELANILIDQFPGLMSAATGGRLDVQVRGVVHDGVWDLDARIAELHTRIRETPGGVAVDQNISRSLVDPYGAGEARGIHLIMGKSQLDCGAYGLTWNEGGRRFSFDNVSDAMYDEYVGGGRVADLLVHETLHQLQDATKAAGQPEAPAPGKHGFPNVDWAEQAPYSRKPDPTTNWMGWYRDMYAAIDYQKLGSWANANPLRLSGPFVRKTAVDPTRPYAGLTDR